MTQWQPQKEPDPGARKPLREMDATELIDWLAAQQEELEDFCSFAQTYIKSRKRRGYRTRTDTRYYQFFERAADLIAGLAEMREYAAETAEEGQEGQEGQERVNE